MKLIAEIDGEKREISVKQTGENISAEINGRAYEVEAHIVEPNVYLLKHENKVYKIYVALNDKPNEPFAVSVGAQDFDVKVIDSKRMRGGARANANANGAAEIKTAMPGKVVRILTNVGAEIKQGDGVLIVEAMKMQNEMKAPKDGIVKEIRAAEGATVSAGDILAVIE